MAVVSPQARDLSPEELEERQALAKGLEDEIINDLLRGRQDLWALCAHLYAFHQEEGWYALGYDHQEDWLAQPEIGMSRSEYMRCVRRFRVYAINREVPIERLQLLDHSKLDIVIPAVQKNLKPMEDVLRDVESLGARDLRETYIGVGDDGASAADGKPGGGAADEDNVIIIDGTATDVPPEPVDKAAEEIDHAAGVVDSWLAVGGDRRKAIRNWKKLRKQHPVFQSIEKVNALIEGEEDAPDREEAHGHWLQLCEALSLNVE